MALTRYDDQNPNISLTGTWSFATDGGYLNTYHYNNEIGASARFNFTGSSLQLYGSVNTNRSTSISVFVDNFLIGTFSQYAGSGVPSIDFTTNSLSNTEHYCRVVNNTTGLYVLDAIDIDSTGILKPYNTLTVGQVWTTPPAGMTRYDNTNSSIAYIGTGWSPDTNSGYYNNTLNATNVNGDSVKFNLIGTKFMLIGRIHPLYSGSISVYVDGINKLNASLYNSTPIDQVCYGSITGLSINEHSVQIINNTTSWMGIDAIDIDSAGLLKPYNANPPKYIIPNPLKTYHYLPFSMERL